MPIQFIATFIVVLIIRFEGRWVHGHSGGVYLVPFRTQKSSPPASIPILWYESPRERKSLCPSSFSSDYPQISLRWALGRYSFGGRPFLRSIRHLLDESTTTRLLEEPMPIDTADIFGSDQVGIHLLQLEMFCFILLNYRNSF